MRRILRMLFALGILAVGVWVLHFAIANSPGAVNKDAIQYWASGRLLLEHSNPYSLAAVSRLERLAGAPAGSGQVMFNPPFALFLALPLGLFAPRTAIFLWVLSIVTSIALTVRILWILQGRPRDGLHLLAYVFAPVMACVQLGQIVPFEVLGLVLFLWLHRERRFLAGMSCCLLAIKPHLLLPFAVVVILWGWKKRQYRMLAGFLVGMGVVSAIPLYFDPGVFGHYLPLIYSAGAFSSQLPNLSSLVHRLDPQLGVLQYALAFAGCCWAVWWYLRRQDAWDWNTDGLLVIAASVLVAPYSFFDDEIVMLPAIVNGIYRNANSMKPLIVFGMLDCAALLLMLFSVKLLSGAYLWTGVAWLGWYCYVLFSSRAGIARDKANLTALNP